MIENIMHFIHTQNTIHFIFPHVLNNPITLTTFMFNFFFFFARSVENKYSAESTPRLE